MNASFQFIAIIFCLLSSFPLRAKEVVYQSEWVLIEKESGEDESLELLIQTANEAVQIYQQNYNKLHYPVKIVVGRKHADDQYDLRSKVVTLSEKNKSGRIAALSAPDIIRHELFHAMYCQGRDVLCNSMNTNLEFWNLQEGLADFFAYSIEPKEYLALNAYSDVAFVRKYVTNKCYSLTGSDHDKGNAIVTALIRENFTIKEVGEYLRNTNSPRVSELINLGLRKNFDSCFFSGNSSPQLRTGSSHNFKSQGSARLYELKGQSDVVTIRLEFNDELQRRFPDAYLQWSLVGNSSPRIRIREIFRDQRGVTFLAEPLSDDFFEDWKVTIYSKEGDELGSFRHGFIKPHRLFNPNEDFNSDFPWMN